MLHAKPYDESALTENRPLGPPQAKLCSVLKLAFVRANVEVLSEIQVLDFMPAAGEAPEIKSILKPAFRPSAGRTLKKCNLKNANEAMRCTKNMPPRCTETFC